MKITNFTTKDKRIENIKGNLFEIPDNTLYILMRNYIRREFSNLTYIKFNEEHMTSAVQTKNSWKVESHNTVTLSMPDGSHIRFGATKNNNVDVTRIISNTKGMGTMMMHIVLLAYVDSMTKYKVEEGATLTLECTGSVGAGSNKRDMPIADQAKFFRKFGFRKIGKYDPNHLSMALQINEDFKKSVEKVLLTFFAKQN